MPPRRILIVGNRLLGDGLDTFPALSLLFRQLSGQGVVFDLLAYRYSHALYRRFPFSQVFLCDDQDDYLSSGNRLATGKRFFRLWRDLRKRYEMICLFPGGWGWALAARLLGANRIIGDGGDYRGFLLTEGDRVSYSQARPNYENFLLVARKALSSSLPSDDQLPEIRKSLPPLVPVADWAGKIPGKPPRRYVVISPTASEPFRAWAGRNFLEIAERLSSRGYGVYWTGLKKEFDGIERMITSGSKGVGVGINTAGSLGLEEVFSLIRGSHGFIGNDSGLAHAAALLGVSTVILYGPSNPTLARPLTGILGGGRAKPLLQIYRREGLVDQERREKIHQQTLDINRITPAEAWKEMGGLFPKVIPRRPGG